MLNIVSIKTYITYGKHATHTFIQESHHEQAIKNSFVRAQVRIEGQNRHIKNLSTLIIIPHLWYTNLRET